MHTQCIDGKPRSDSLKGKLQVTHLFGVAHMQVSEP